MDGWITIGTKLDNKKLDKDIVAVEKELNDLNRAYDTTRKMKPYEGQKKDLRELEKAMDRAEAKLMKLNQKQESINIAQVGNIGTTINSISNSTSDIIKKVGKWALAIFSVRSAYMFITRASSTLARYNEQYAKNLEYIRYSLAQMLAPVLEYIVSLVFKLLSYINYIANAWFGVNLFSKASAKNFGSMANSAKTIQKSLAGFDEMNVLSDTSNSGGAGGAVLPSMDLSQIQGEVPSWIKWIADNGEFVLAIIAGIASALLAIKISEIAKALGLVEVGLSAIKALGIGAIVAGIVLLIKDIIDYIKDPSWKNFIAILGDIAIVIGGIMLVLGSWWGLLVVIIGAIVKLVVENWDAIKEILSVVGDWIYKNVIEPVVNFFSKLWEKIKEIFSPFIEFFKSIFSTFYENIQTTIENIKEIFSFLWEKIKEIFEPVVNFFKEKFTEAYNKIKEVFGPVLDFITELWNKIKEKIGSWGTKIGEIIGNAFKVAFNGIMEKIENFLNTPIKAINKLIGIINEVPGINLSKLSTFSLPRLKAGGIINQPGRGVYVGGAIAGEAGAEGVLPLTDSQAMETLGQAIGRYITINANITNQMNGRVISRQLQQIKANNDFAYNT